MQSIGDFSKYFIWEARGYLLPLTLSVPAALVAISLAGYVNKNISVTLKKIGEAKKSLISSFTQKEGETDAEFRKRAAKNIFTGARCTALFTGMAASPFQFLPSYLAIPTAIASICLLGDALINGESYRNRIEEKIQSMKEWAYDAFHEREGESEEDASRRIDKNIALTALGAMIASGAIGAAAFGIHYALSQNVSIWDMYNLLPFQTPAVVFLEYAAVGLAHSALAAKNRLQEKRGAAAFHYSNFGLSFAFPIFYLLESNPANPMRLHHSIIGLSLALLPFNTLKAIGATITLDSALYFFSSCRGYVSGGKFVSYDFMNFFLDHLSTYIPVLAAMTGAEYAIDRILPKEEEINGSSAEAPEERFVLQNGVGASSSA